MQFIEAEDAFQLFDVYCDCETEVFDGKNESFRFFLSLLKTFDMKFEANCNLKTYSTISQSGSVLFSLLFSGYW